MIRAFLARRRDARTRKLRGIATFTTLAFNPVNGATVPLKSTAKLFSTNEDVRSVEVSDPALMNKLVVSVWLHGGPMPADAVVCA